MICPRCYELLDPTQPTATLEVWGFTYRLHAPCGRAWQAERRTALIESVRFTDRLSASVRSLVIHAPAEEVSA